MAQDVVTSAGITIVGGFIGFVLGILLAVTRFERVKILGLVANPGLDLATKYISKNGASFIGVEKGEIDLLQWVNVWIMHKKLNGTLNDISLKWLGQPLPELPTF